MCGLYCAITALLVTASSHIAAESSQSKPLQALSNGFVASSGTVDEALSLQESHVPQNDLMLNEERGPSVTRNFLGKLERGPSVTRNFLGELERGPSVTRNFLGELERGPPATRNFLGELERGPPATRNFLGELEHTVSNTRGAMNTDTEDVIAKVAKAREGHDELIPRSKAEISRRKRMDPTPIDLDGQALHALPNPGKMSVSGASNLPSVLAKRLVRGEPSVIMANAARSRTQHDLQLPLSSPSTSSVASSNIRFDKKAVEFDTIDHPGEVEVRHSKHQRVSPTLFTMNDQEFSALPNFEEAPVWVASDAPFVLAKRLGKDSPTFIINNAAEVLKKHDFRPATSRQSVPTDWNAEILRGPKKLVKFHVTEVVIKIHAAFLEAFSLPFHQYPRETAKMISIFGYISDGSPSNRHPFKTFKSLAENEQPAQLKRLLEPDLNKLLGNGMASLHDHPDNLEEAYIVKLLIMYELFYDFGHSRSDLFVNVPRKIQRSNVILLLATSIQEFTNIVIKEREMSGSPIANNNFRENSKSLAAKK